MHLDKKLIGLVGAAALAPLGVAQAAPVMVPNPDLKAASFAELLTPIPNAVDKLEASDALLTERQANAAKIEMVQYYHHHHHHHRFFRRFFHHHHHHHFYRRRFHHHHHFY